MKLVIGGYGQGKLDYVLAGYPLQESRVWDGCLPDDGAGAAARKETPIINHFHNWVKKRIAEGGCPEEEILSFLDSWEDCIIICDEIGNGIVPLERSEREYRERTGRILTELAGRAEGVERVLCGIGQKIK